MRARCAGRYGAVGRLQCLVIFRSCARTVTCVQGPSLGISASRKSGRQSDKALSRVCHHSCATGEVDPPVLATARATTPSRSKPPSRDCALSRRTSMRDAAERSVARCRKHTRARLTGSFAFLVCVSRDAQAAQTREKNARACFSAYRDVRCKPPSRDSGARHARAI